MEIVKLTETGIGTIKKVTAQNVIGIMKGDIILVGERQLKPIDVLREHVAHSSPEDRKTFTDLESQLTTTKPDQDRINSALTKLNSSFGGLASCAEAINKIVDAVTKFPWT
jgi:hypothetical protein